LAPASALRLAFRRGSGLLEGLEEEVTDQTGAQAPGRQKGLDLLDRAELIERRLGGADQLRRAVESILAREPLRVSIQHQLLASLPVTEAATTNYDELFETAWQDAVSPEARGGGGSTAAARGAKALDIAVLRGDDARAAPRWLLKLHGSVNSGHREIVLSRSDYLSFEAQSGPLAGVLQSMLVTRHILFVGFSLTDPNFQRIALGVQRMLEGGSLDDGPVGSQRFGTVLTPGDPASRRDLWKGQVQFVSMLHPSTTTPSSGSEVDGEDQTDRHSLRQTEIFLDLVVSEATVPVAFVRDRTYRTLLGQEEQQLAASLGELERLARERSAARGEGDAVADALRRMLEPFSPDAADWRRSDWRR